MDNFDFATFTNAMGNFFEQVAEQMTDYLQINFNTIASDPAKLSAFTQQHETIHSLATQLFSFSDQAAFDGAKDLYKSVKDATDSMNAEIRNIEKADKWINFSAGIINLGLAITSKNNAGIISSIQSIKDAVTSKPPGDAAAS